MDKLLIDLDTCLFQLFDESNVLFLRIILGFSYNMNKEDGKYLSVGSKRPTWPFP